MTVTLSAAEARKLELWAQNDGSFDVKHLMVWPDDVEQMITWRVERRPDGQFDVTLIAMEDVPPEESPDAPAVPDRPEPDRL
jgi:hypothetical protein